MYVVFDCYLMDVLKEALCSIEWPCRFVVNLVFVLNSAPSDTENPFALLRAAIICVPARFEVEGNFIKVALEET